MAHHATVQPADKSKEHQRLVVRSLKKLAETAMNRPRILILNDDRRLLETRKMLLQDCGAEVFTARGSEESLRATLNDPVDLVLIDATNVGLEHAEKLCSLVKSLRLSECIALLIKPEISIPAETIADRVIHRSGPRKMLVEINELLDGRLDVGLWENRGDNEDEDRSMGEPT